MRALTRRDLSRFLRTFARQLPCPTTLILTGGSEALVLGGTRPTGDVDFGLVVRSQRRWIGGMGGVRPRDRADASLASSA